MLGMLQSLQDHVDSVGSPKVMLEIIIHLSISLVSKGSVRNGDWKGDKIR